MNALMLVLSSVNQAIATLNATTPLIQRLTAGQEPTADEIARLQQAIDIERAKLDAAMREYNVSG